MRYKFAMAALAACLVLFDGASFGEASGQTDKPSKKELTRAADEIFVEWTDPGSPGAAVILTDGGEVILRRCYGLADIEHGVPIEPATRFELASVSKSFTAFAVLLLEQSGKLSLGDDIHKYLPELPDYGLPITVGNLVHHTSGISDYVHVLAYAGRSARAGFGIDNLIRLVAKQRLLEFTPGANWAYSNTNYALLAEIVARVTDEPFGEWMRKNVFEPLEMRDTSFPAKGTAVLPQRANAYHRGGGTFNRSLVEDWEIPGPAHAFSTVDDMAKWMENLRTGKVGGFRLIAKMQEGAALANGDRTTYGAGVGVGEYRGLRTIGHSGQTGAFKTEYIYCPEVEVGVVVLSNAGWMQADRTARRVLDVYLARQLKPAPETAADMSGDAEEAPPFHLEPVEYERFLGGYRLDADPSVLVAVAREGDWLVGVLVGEGLDFFKPVGPAEFENRHHNCRLAFIDDESAGGAVASVRITLRGEEMRATRVEIPADAGGVDECTGLYYSDELEAAWEIVREPAGFAVRIPASDDRPLQPADTDILAGGVGILTLLRDGNGRIIGFDFGEPEDFGARRIRFTKCGGSF